MVTMNIYVLGQFASGFTLDKVKVVDKRYIQQSLIDLAQERFFTRRMGIAFGSDLFEASQSPETVLLQPPSRGRVSAG